MTRDDSSEDIEIQLLLEGMYLRYGYDFRGYTPASMKRRVMSALSRSGCANILQLTHRMLHDPEFYRVLVSELTINVTEMFRDPDAYLALRRHILPVLRTYPSIRIWHAGCATGEEAYSMAILLQEEGLYERSVLYATDISSSALRRAREGVYSATQLKAYTANYQQSGGVEPFSNYYTAEGNSLVIDPGLRRNIVFSEHNLATDDVFSEFHLVICRNVLIYFDRALQRRVIELFSRSLVRRGFLCLGPKETMEGSGMEKSYETLCKVEKIYRKI